MSEKTIGTLSKFTGISTHTIKYYEKIGLISSNRKEHSNYRSYDMRICTDIYEAVKYRNMGFPLKETKEILKEATDQRLEELLQIRRTEIEEQIAGLQEQLRQLTIYQEQNQELDSRLGRWYIEECGDFYLRAQTRDLEFDEEACLESDGLNLAEYMPVSQSTVWMTRQYLEGRKTGFSWGQGVFPGEREERIKGRKGYIHIPACRAFVAYLRMSGYYVSDGRMAEEVCRVYHQYRKETPEEAFGIRVRICLDEEGTQWNYFKIFIPLKEE